MVGVDRALGEIRAGLGPEDVLLVASDHGFQADDDGDRRIWTSSLEPRARSRRPRAGARRLPLGLAVLRRHDPRAARAVRRARRATERLVERALGPPLDAGRRAHLHRRRHRRRAAPAGTERPVDNCASAQWVVRQAARLLFDVEFGADAHAWILARPNAAVLDPLWPDGRVAWNGKEWPLREVAGPDDFTGRHDRDRGLPRGGRADPEAPRAAPPLGAADRAAPRTPGRRAAPRRSRAPAPLPRPGSRVARREPGAHGPRRVAPAAARPRRESDPAAGDAELRERLRGLGYLR